MTVGIMHPGEMGTSLGAALIGNHHDVVWASAGRSSTSRARAEADGLTDRFTLRALVEECDTLVSVCPPGAAAAVAAEIANLGFRGHYLDANAVAPSTARTIDAVISAGGATFVDGGIVGPPARYAGLTVLYLSGNEEACIGIVDLFADSLLGTHVVAGGAGAASAVKMAFAAWTKGTGALLLAIRALAESEGVVDSLDHAWSLLTPDLTDRLPATVRGTAPKAWRFVGEMEEIATSFADAGLPDGFHLAAAQVYEKLAGLRGQLEVDVDDVLGLLLAEGS